MSDMEYATLPLHCCLLEIENNAGYEWWPCAFVAVLAGSVCRGSGPVFESSSMDRFSSLQLLRCLDPYPIFELYSPRHSAGILPADMSCSEMPFSISTR